MRKYLQTYIDSIDGIDPDYLNADEKHILCKHMRTRIGFFQHERLIHLIVLITVAILMMLSLILLLSWNSIWTVVLFLLFMLLLIPYLIHYYFLENGVQKLYRIYDRFDTAHGDKK